MSTAVAKLVDKFDALSKTQKKEAARVILNRVLDDSAFVEVPKDYGDIPDEAFSALSAELFKIYDEDEARDARR